MLAKEFCIKNKKNYYDSNIVNTLQLELDRNRKVWIFGDLASTRQGLII